MCLFYSATPLLTVAQVRPLVNRANDSTQNIRPVRNPMQGIKPSPLDTLKGGAPLDTLNLKMSEDLKDVINYSANDSIVTSVDSKIVRLYGGAKIIYGEIELEAEEIVIDYNTNQLHATGHLDSLGRRVGFPIFKNGDEVYETKDITYDFITKKARIKEVVTEQGDGFLHGETVLKNERDEILSVDNSYTTCNLAHPHFRIRSSKTKAIPDDKIVSGPFHLEILDVPTPLGLPFGMFPAPKKSASGIIMPTYGEEARRGFYLRQGGYFFDLNEYIKLRVTGDLYSKGSYGLNVNSNYSVRYRYSGNFNISMTRNRLSEKIEDPTVSTDYQISWSHAPQTRGTGKFTASVNAATSSFTQNNYLGVNYDLNSSNLDNTTRKLSSSLSYTKQFGKTPFSMGVSARHNQDLQTKLVDLQLPDFYATMRSIYPFKKASNKEVLNKLNLRYNIKGSNRITNRYNDPAGLVRDSIIPFGMETLPRFFEDANKGMRHTIPLSTSFKLWKFNVSPALNYEEKWYFDKLDWSMNQAGTLPIITDTIPGFNRVIDYSGSVSFNTRIYGTYLFEKGKVQAIRHVINPSISYNYQPDFSSPEFDYYQKFQLPSGNEVFKSRHQGYVYGSASLGEAQSIGLSINNTLEMKVLDTSDSTSESKKYKKVPLIKSFGLSSAYNFVADSFNLSNISLRANTSVFQNKLNINLTGAIDPYIWMVDSTGTRFDGEKIIYQHRVNEFAFKSGQGIGKFNRAVLSLSTNFNPKKREQEESTRSKILNSQLSEADKMWLLNNPDSYVDFSIPWSLRVNYNLSYSKTGFAAPKVTQSMTVSGDLSLSEKWKIGFRSGYDFENGDFTQTNFNISRDLHCWEMNMNWTPFGRFTSYNFMIRAKSALLQDLKVNRRRSFFDY